MKSLGICVSSQLNVDGDVFLPPYTSIDGNYRAHNKFTRESLQRVLSLVQWNLNLEVGTTIMSFHISFASAFIKCLAHDV